MLSHTSSECKQLSFTWPQSNNICSCWGENNIGRDGNFCSGILQKHGLFVSNRPCQRLSAIYESLNKMSIHPIVGLPGLNVLQYSISATRTSLIESLHSSKSQTKHCNLVVDWSYFLASLQQKKIVVLELFPGPYGLSLSGFEQWNRAGLSGVNIRIEYCRNGHNFLQNS